MRWWRLLRRLQRWLLLPVRLLRLRLLLLLLRLLPLLLRLLLRLCSE